MAILKLSPENQQWLDGFKVRHGRSPRILHIGNIANNAYNNAKLLNEVGFDCDVICYDYYHIMGCPEWEDANFSGDYGNQLKPNWVAAGVSNFERPRWFAQGPLLICIDYLIARRKGNKQEADASWCKLETMNGSKKNTLWSLFHSSGGKVSRALRFFVAGCGVVSRIAAIERVAAATSSEIVRLSAAWCLLTFALIARIGWLPVRLARKILRGAGYAPPRGGHSFDAKVAELIDKFAEAFPSRLDALTASDLEMYRSVAPHWQRLFRQYDLVQAYATDPILPMLADKQPYIGFEHGTLRSHTLCNEPVCRLTSLGYHLADHVFITNGDCIDYAHKIGVTRFTPMLHPVDERRIDAIEGGYERLHSELGVRYVFLCTLRHDWVIKGTDKYIRALPSLANLLGRDFRVIMTRWGAELKRSIALAESLGVADLIVWSEPLSRRKLIRTLKSVDVLFDQLALPHFGATAPEGIAAGVPVIMSYDPVSTEWIIPKPAPILSARTEDEIVSAVIRALDPIWLSSYKQEARSWFNKYHSASVLVEKHSHAYREIFRKNGLI